jgi:hypothetical protein
MYIEIHVCSLIRTNDTIILAAKNSHALDRAATVIDLNVDTELNILFSDASIIDILRKPIDNRTGQLRTDTILEPAVS